METEEKEPGNKVAERELEGSGQFRKNKYLKVQMPASVGHVNEQVSF